MNWKIRIGLASVLQLFFGFMMILSEDKRMALAKFLSLPNELLVAVFLLGNSACTLLIAIWVNRMTTEEHEASLRQKSENEQREHRKEIEEFNARMRQKAPVTQIDCAYDFFRGESEILLTDSNQKLYLPPTNSKPLSLREKLRSLNPSLEFHNPHFLSHHTDLRAFLRAGGIPSFQSLLDEAVESAALHFIDNARNDFRKYYNADKFGIRELSTTRHRISEKPLLRLSVYRTDYFTHIVMRRLVKLIDARHRGLLDEVEPGHLIGRYPFLFTRLGINMMIVTKESVGHAVLIQKRSMHSPLEENHHKWHVSLNEGFSIMDTDPDTGRPSLNVCFMRGLLEELGIPSTDVASYGFFDIFLVRGVVEVGIAGVAFLNLNFREVIEHRKAAANDAMENDTDFEIAEYSVTSLRTLLEDRSKNCSDALRYCLEVLIARRCPQP